MVCCCFVGRVGRWGLGIGNTWAKEGKKDKSARRPRSRSFSSRARSGRGLGGRCRHREGEVVGMGVAWNIRSGGEHYYFSQLWSIDLQRIEV